MRSLTNSSRRRFLHTCALVLLLSLVAVACGSAERPTLSDEVPVEAEEGSDSEEPVDPSEQRFPNVIEVAFGRSGQGPYSFDVTISSPYDTPERYADAWRIVDADGTVYGTRVLTHHHAAEQPFTRSLSGVEIPEDVTELLIEARDSVNGWGGGTVDVRLDQGP